MTNIATRQKGAAVVADLAQHIRKEVVVNVWKQERGPTVLRYLETWKGRLEDVRENAIWISPGEEKRGVDFRGIWLGLQLTFNALVDFNSNTVPGAAIRYLRTCARFTSICMWRVKVPRPIRGINFKAKGGDAIISIHLSSNNETIYKN
jgi:hypothetical protein